MKWNQTEAWFNPIYFWEKKKISFKRKPRDALSVEQACFELSTSIRNWNHLNSEVSSTHLRVLTYLLSRTGMWQNTTFRKTKSMEDAPSLQIVILQTLFSTPFQVFVDNKYLWCPLVFCPSRVCHLFYS